MQLKTPSSPPPAPVLELDGLVWRPAEARDARLLAGLAAVGDNAVLFNLPTSAHEFALRVDQPGFRSAMVCERGGEVVGAAATARRDNRNLHLQLLCMFADPSASTLALAMYVRHLFWSHPLNRIHVQMPVVAGTEAYIALFTSCGFQLEGVARTHGIVGGQMCDVALLGVLRADFARWAEEEESRLKL